MLIKPKLPVHFFDRDIGLRSEAEINKFWNVPIILTDEYGDHHDKTWTEYQERVSGPKNKYTIETEEEFNKWMQEKKDAWLKHFPTGTAYHVHCHDGGVWNRPTSWGSFGTLEEAKRCCWIGAVMAKRKGRETLLTLALINVYSHV